MKNIRVTLLLAAFVFTWATSLMSCSPEAGATLPKAPNVEVFFTPKAADDPTGIYFNMKKFFESANSSIYGSAHEVDMIEIAELLARRADEGIDVRLVVEERWLSSHKNSVAVDVLRNSKIKLIPDTRKSGLMHNKFFIIDKKRVWTGSTNITTTCLLYNYNNSILIDDPKVAENFLVEFYEQEEGKFGKKGSGPNNTPHPVLEFENMRIETYFAPEDAPVEPIVAMIRRATSQIDVLCFVFTSQEIAEEIIKAHNRGVKVRVLLDNGFRSENMTRRWSYVPAEEFDLSGIDVAFDDEDAKIHHKLMICDRKEVLTGSLNLSKNGAETNDENIVIVASDSIGKIYQEEFDRLWGYFTSTGGAKPATSSDTPITEEPEPDPFDSEGGDDIQ